MTRDEYWPHIERLVQNVLRATHGARLKALDSKTGEGSFQLDIPLAQGAYFPEVGFYVAGRRNSRLTWYHRDTFVRPPQSVSLLTASGLTTSWSVPAESYPMDRSTGFYNPTNLTWHHVYYQAADQGLENFLTHLETIYCNRLGCLVALLSRDRANGPACTRCPRLFQCLCDTRQAA